MTVLHRLLLDRRRGATWWAIGMVFAVASIVGLYPTVEGNADIERVAEDLPAGVRALIGSQADISLASAAGYLQGRLFSNILPILLVIYAIGLGARAIGGAEEDGTLQLVTAAPISRRRIASERLAGSAALLLGLAAVGLATTFGLGLTVGIFDDITIGRVLLATTAVTALAVLHLAGAFAVGASTGRRGPAVALVSAVTVGTYVLHGIAASAEPVRALRAVSPWWWLLDRNLLVQDPTFLALGLPLLLVVVLVAVGLWRYDRRDLRYP